MTRSSIVTAIALAVATLIVAVIAVVLIAVIAFTHTGVTARARFEYYQSCRLSGMTDAACLSLMNTRSP